MRLCAKTKHHTADVINTTDYYPFGSPKPGRNFNSSEYRYGFNGMEKDDEVKGSGNSYDFGARIYDPRVGRWLSEDKDFKVHPGISPYRFGLNNPIIFIDPEGNTEYLAVTTIQPDGKKSTNYIEISNKYYRAKAKRDNWISPSKDYHIVYEYYDIYHEVVININEDGSTTMEAKGSVLSEKPAYTRWPQFSLIPEIKFSGEGGTSPGGIQLTSSQGGVSPTKYKAENDVESVNIEALLLAIGVKSPSTKTLADVADKIRNIVEITSSGEGDAINNSGFEPQQDPIDGDTVKCKHKNCGGFVIQGTRDHVSPENTNVPNEK